VADLGTSSDQLHSGQVVDWGIIWLRMTQSVLQMKQALRGTSRLLPAACADGEASAIFFDQV
jgi:hypothetical protein